MNRVLYDLTPKPTGTIESMQCKDADELMALAKANGFDITKDEAEAYMVEMADVELDGEQLKSVAGGHDYFCWHCPTDFDCTKNK